MIPFTNPSSTLLNLKDDPRIAIVLVEPRIPQNTGNIARLCACTGADLYLVGSLGFRLNDKYLERAGMDYLDDIPIHHVPDFKDVLAAKPGWTPYFVSTKAQVNYTDAEYPQDVLLVFGSESHGLPAWLIEENPDNSVRIPMRANTRSLNLSNSVAIVLYEAIRQRLITM
ncbi:MAG: tRNA ((34)/cytosine(34)/5-carboxymethylaminomethyluridine(34)-2-O)-methyltransferase TrmL [Vampirovibrio sp.]|jgi:tRNA (cytidine/uridine-2'-O-)-methyltransferase|nr:tRNA ((34)/cytosine(34)/5-carboxymethylaminomethyluridine(34)-2-O)-methyltransferase TrmL [Vampirovibrio sp.]